MKAEGRREGRFAQWRQALRHAFALEESDETLPAEDRALLAKVADFVVKRGMTAPAILFLASLQPLSFIGSQAMVFFQPILTSFFSRKEYGHLARILERRESVDRLIELIEEADRAYRRDSG